MKIEAKYIKSKDRRISGWYATNDGPMPDQAEMLWADQGNGPKLAYPDNIYGPFESRAHAKAAATGDDLS